MIGQALSQPARAWDPGAAEKPGPRMRTERSRPDHQTASVGAEHSFAQLLGDAMNRPAGLETAAETPGTTQDPAQQQGHLERAQQGETPADLRAVEGGVEGAPNDAGAGAADSGQDTGADHGGDQAVDLAPEEESLAQNAPASTLRAEVGAVRTPEDPATAPVAGTVLRPEPSSDADLMSTLLPGSSAGAETGVEAGPEPASEPARAPVPEPVREPVRETRLQTMPQLTPQSSPATGVSAVTAGVSHPAVEGAEAAPAAPAAPAGPAAPAAPAALTSPASPTAAAAAIVPIPAATPPLTTPVGALAAPALRPGAAVPLHLQLTGPIAQLSSGPQGERVLTVHVAPEALGPVTVRANISGEQIRIELTAGAEPGREALRAMLTDLRRDLAGQGLSSAQVSIGDGDPAQGRPEDPPGSRSREAPVPEQEAPSESSRDPASLATAEDPSLPGGPTVYLDRLDVIA